MSQKQQYPLKWLTEFLAVGYAPRSAEHLHTILSTDIAAIVNLCGECYDLHEIEQEAGFEVYYLPVADEAAPSLGELESVINWMNLQSSMGKKILVHCRYGIGRTGTVVLAFLLQLGYSFKEARKLMSPTPSWPSNREQKELVERFVQKVRGHSIKENFSGNSSSANTFFNRLKAMLEWEK